MRAREIVARPLSENMFKTMAQDLKGAVTEPFQKLQTIGSTPGAWTSPGIAAQALDQREREEAMKDIAQRRQQKSAQVVQQTQQRARDLAQQWAQQFKTQNAQQQTQPSSASGGTTVSPTPTVTIGSVGKLTKGDGGYWYNEQGQPVTDPAQAAKIDKAYQDQEYRKKQFQQTAVVKERSNKSRQNANRRAQARKGTTATPGATEPNDPSGFIAWSDAQLRDTIPGTRTEINMDSIKKDSTLYQPVKAALDRVLKDPSNTAVVQDYFETAMSAMQQLSSQIKRSSSAYSNAGAAGAGGSELLSRFMSSSQLQDLQRVAKDPTAATQIKKELGIR